MNTDKMVTQRRRRLRSQSLLAVVRVFLEFGVPMDGSAAWDLSCAYCGRAAVDLPTLGHTDTCLWARLRDRAAEERM